MVSGRSPSPRRRSSPTPARSSYGSDGLERLRQLSPAFDWHEAVGLAADRTKLYPGDLVAGPSCGVVEPIAPGVTVEVVVDGIGELDAVVARE